MNYRFIYQGVILQNNIMNYRFIYQGVISSVWIDIASLAPFENHPCCIYLWYTCDVFDLNQV